MRTERPIDSFAPQSNIHETLLYHECPHGQNHPGKQSGFCECLQVLLRGAHQICEGSLAGIIIGKYGLDWKIL